MGRDLRDFYRSDRACCLSIPLFHVGIYSVLAVQLTFSLFGALMCFVGPPILSLVEPNGYAMALGALYVLLTLLHSAGIVAVYRNLTQPFRIFKVVATFFVGIVSTLSLVAIIYTATQHTESITQCYRVFTMKVHEQDSIGSSGSGGLLTSNGDGSNDAERLGAANRICSVFSWIQVVAMVLSWCTVMGIQVYFAVKEQIYFKLKLEDAIEDAKV